MLVTNKENVDPGLPISLSGKVDLGLDTPPCETPEESPQPPKDPRLRKLVLPNPMTDDLSPTHLKRGVLIPLKTTQEVRQDHTIVQARITRAPTKTANDVLT